VCLLGLAAGQAGHPLCKAGGTTYHPSSDVKNCREYYVCHNGFRGVAQCPEGFYHKKCEKADECLTEKAINELALKDPTCKCKLCGTDDTGKLFPKPDSPYCDEYYTCANTIQVDLKCPEGQSFDKGESRCKDAKLVDCDIDTCAKTYDSTMKKYLVARAPNLKNCNEYFVCAEGKNVLTLPCGDGFMYDVNQKEDFNGVLIEGKCVRIPRETAGLYADPCPCCAEGVELPAECKCDENCSECADCATNPVNNANTCVAKCSNGCAKSCATGGIPEFCKLECPECIDCGKATETKCEPGCPNSCAKCCDDNHTGNCCTKDCSVCTDCANNPVNSETCPKNCANGCAKCCDDGATGTCCKETCNECVGCDATTVDPTKCKKNCPNYKPGPEEPTCADCCKNGDTNKCCKDTCTECSECGQTTPGADKCEPECPNTCEKCCADDATGECCKATCQECSTCTSATPDPSTCKAKCPNKNPDPPVTEAPPTVPTTEANPPPSTPQCFTGRNWNPVIV
jgi:hypothetical protein